MTKKVKSYYNDYRNMNYIEQNDRGRGKKEAGTNASNEI